MRLRLVVRSAHRVRSPVGGMLNAQNRDYAGFELRPVGDELVVFDLESNETHVLAPKAAKAFKRGDVDRRLLLKGGAVGGALLGAGVVQTLLAPPAAAACSIGSPTISATPAPVCNLTPANSKNVTISIAGFSAAAVTVTATGDATGTGNKASGTTTITPTIDCATTAGSLVLTIKQAQNVTITATQGTKTASIGPVPYIAC